MRRPTRLTPLLTAALVVAAGGQLAGVAEASESKCPAPAPFHYERWTSSSLVFPSSGIQTFTYQISGLPVHKHYKAGVAEWDVRSGPTLPGTGNRRYILLWLRSTGGNYKGYNWAMALKKSGADEVVSQVELTSWTGVISQEWATNTRYHFKEEWDAEAGTFTCTVTNVDAGTVIGSVSRAQLYSFWTEQGRLQFHIGWDVDGSDGYHWPPYGWEFENYTLDLTPGGPFGPDAPECPGGLDWVTASLPDGEVGTAYSASLQATAGTGAYTFSMDTGLSLPNGLGLDAATGVISGTPTTEASGAISFRVTDSDDEYISKELSLTITSGAIVPDGGPPGDGGGTAGGGPVAGGGPGGGTATGSGTGGGGLGGVDGAEPAGPASGIVGDCSCSTTRTGPPHALALLVSLLLGLGIRRRR